MQTGWSLSKEHALSSRDCEFRVVTLVFIPGLSHWGCFVLLGRGIVGGAMCSGVPACSLSFSVCVVCVVVVLLSCCCGVCNVLHVVGWCVVVCMRLRGVWFAWYVCLCGVKSTVFVVKKASVGMLETSPWGRLRRNDGNADQHGTTPHTTSSHGHHHHHRTHSPNHHTHRASQTTHGTTS